MDTTIYVAFFIIQLFDFTAEILVSGQCTSSSSRLRVQLILLRVSLLLTCWFGAIYSIASKCYARPGQEPFIVKLVHCALWIGNMFTGAVIMSMFPLDPTRCTMGVNSLLWPSLMWLLVAWRGRLANFESRATAESEQILFSDRKDIITGTTNCIICLASGKQSVFLPCMHAYVCTVCAVRLDSCPMCRSDIKRVVLVSLEDNE